MIRKKIDNFSRKSITFINSSEVEIVVIYVTEQGAEIGVKRTRIQIRKEGKILDTFRTEEIEQIAIYGLVQISTHAIRVLLAQGIDLVFLSQGGTFLGRLSGGLRKNAALRHTQHQLLDKPDICLQLAKRFIEGKLYNQRALLMRYQRKLKDPRITEAIVAIRYLMENISTATDLSMLLGIEGRAAAYYFGILGLLISVPDITFTQRIRRPPPDPTNILLSFGYTLLGNLIQGYTELASLDPYLGALHQIKYGRPSLALDLLEEWRPVIVDVAVLRALNTRSIRAQHFTPVDVEDAPVEELWEQNDKNEENRDDTPGPPRKLILSTEGSKRWFAAYERRLNEVSFYAPQRRTLSYRQIIREQVYLFTRHLLNEEPYFPFLYNDT
jgi:CRISPR-associated protein Cas1